MNPLMNFNPESISHVQEKSKGRPCAAEAIVDTEAKKLGTLHVRLTHVGN